MLHISRPARRTLSVVGVIVLVCVGSPVAHEKKVLGPINLTIGWGDEPAFSGAKNSIDVDIADATGAPLTKLDGPFSVDVSFGDERVSLPLLPVKDHPGKYRAWLVPTRAGRYTFHITGRVKGQAVDVTSTCSDKTFECVADASDIQFPAKDPSTGQLADRMNRALPRAERALDTAATARTIGLVAIAVAALAAVTTIGRGIRKGRKAV